MSKIRIATVLAGMFGMLCTALLGLAAPALAHDELQRSSPSDGATITELPRQIMLYFEEPPVAGFTRVTVTGPGGRKFNSSGPVVTGSRLSERLKTSGSVGSYLIRYRIMSDDGHPVSGTVHFVLGTRPAGSKAAATSGATHGSAASSTTLLYGLAAAAVVALVLAAAAPARAAARRVAPATPAAPDGELASR